MDFTTCDLSDAHEAELAYVAPVFQRYGKNPKLAGAIVTVKVFEDNALVREALSTDGTGKVLVVDGGGSLRCALLGDLLAKMAADHGWSGVVVYGCIRDSQAIAEIPIGVRALATHPKKTVKRGWGERDVAVTFAGVTFVPGHYLYADEDGILVSPRALV